MKKLSTVALYAVLLAAQGCTLTLPTGLNGVNGLPPTVTPNGCKPVDANKDGKISNEELLASCGDKAEPPKGEPKPGQPTEPGRPPETQPGIPGMPPKGDHDALFVKFDADANGSWNFDEFAAWYGMQPRPAIACAEPSTTLRSDGNIIAAGGGNVVMQSDDGASLISNDAGSVVGHDGSMMVAPPGDNRCDDGSDPKRRFMQMDANHDGNIQREEFMRLHVPGPRPQPYPYPQPNDCKDTFQRADANQDGFVDFDEYQRADYQPMQGPISPNDGDMMMARPAVMPTYEDMKARFVKRDHNGDGRLDGGEFCGDGDTTTSPPILPDCLMGKADRDGNGEVSWEEFHGWLSPNSPNASKDELYSKFKSQDSSGDGVLTEDEWCPEGSEEEGEEVSGDCAMRFKNWDADGNGTVSFSEFADGKWGEIRFIRAPSPEEEARMRANFQAIAKLNDTNRDGQLNAEEFTKVCQDGDAVGGGGTISANGGGLISTNSGN